MINCLPNNNNNNTSFALVIRAGPASGKSTFTTKLVDKLREEYKLKIFFIEQDNYRNEQLGNNYHKSKELVQENCEISMEMMISNALIALSKGYSIVCEGILNEKYYNKLFDVLDRETNTKFIYYYVSEEERIKRHEARPKGKLIDTNLMLTWKCEKLKNHTEIMFDGTLDLDISIDRILRELKI